MEIKIIFIKTIKFKKHSIYIKIDIMRKNRNYWSKENCMIEALKYSTRSEFKFNSPSAYCSARKNDFLLEICSHMIKLGNISKRCIYAYEFSDNHVYVGLTCNIKKRMIWRKNNSKDAVTKHINNTGLSPQFIQLTDYLSINDASEMEGVFLENYKNNGWKLLNVAKTGGIGGNHLIWTFDKCKNEALKYNLRNDFRINSGSAYNSAQRNLWLNEICSHMKKYEREIILSFDICEKEALKYNTKKEFSTKSSSIYSTSVKNGWIDKICGHMQKLPYNTIYWIKERCADAAQQCKTKTEFAKMYGGAYYNARKNNWLNEFFK
ncbi:MAG: hypothetical protein WC428_00240 [Candidatus Paceibacterota bacterium]|jgi:hypothetical protein